MKRGVILIGVQEVESLPKLEAVWDGVKRMQKWALDQGIDESLIKTITDQAGRVRADQIMDAVTDLIKPANRLEQLIIYFAGHGINRNYSEYWLLTEAINNPNAAVNLAGSIQRSRYCRVPHVVFISDACRTASMGIQAGGVTGSIIFPNPPGGASVDVDVSYATTLGEPALEISDPNQSAKQFTAIYTNVLLGALRGEHGNVAVHDDDLQLRVIRAKPLKDYLAKELPIRVYQLTRGQNPRSQKPDAIITSGENAWLSSLKGGTGPVPITGTEPDQAALEHAEFINRGSIHTIAATREVMTNPHLALAAFTPPTVTATRTAGTDLDIVTSINERFSEHVRAASESFGRTRFETNCGFKVRNARVVSCTIRTGYEILEDGHAVRADVVPGQCVSTLLTFSNGYSVVLPAIGEFVTGLTFDEDNLIDVTYEPSTGSDRWPMYQSQRKKSDD